MKLIIILNMMEMQTMEINIKFNEEIKTLSFKRKRNNNNSILNFIYCLFLEYK